VAEVEERDSHRVVEVEKLGVLAQRVHDDLGYARVEVDAWDQTVLVNDFLQVTVGQKDKLLVGSLVLLSDVVTVVGCLWAGLALTKDLGELLNTFSLLNVSDDAIVLLDEVADDGLEQTHAGVLAGVPEVVQIVFQVADCVVSHADVDQSCLNKFGALEKRLGLHLP